MRRTKTWLEEQGIEDFACHANLKMNERNSLSPPKSKVFHFD
jgi:hypothetical protein